MLIKHKMLGLHAQNLHMRPKWCCVVWINHFKSHCDFPDLMAATLQRFEDKGLQIPVVLTHLWWEILPFTSKLFVKSNYFKTESQMLIIAS